MEGDFRRFDTDLLLFLIGEEAFELVSAVDPFFSVFAFLELLPLASLASLVTLASLLFFGSLPPVASSAFLAFGFLASFGTFWRFLDLFALPSF